MGWSGYFPTDTAFGRSLFTITNPGATEVTDTFIYASDVGSDRDTEVEGTSSGGDTFDDFTGWAVTSDNDERDEFGNGDMVALSVGQGPQPTAATPTLDRGFESRNDTWEIDFEVTVPAGEVRYLAFFFGVSDYNYGECTDSGITFAAATTAMLDAATGFDSLSALAETGLLAGIPEYQIPCIANWNPAPTELCVEPTPGPTPGPSPDPGPGPSPDPTPAPVTPKFTG